MAADRDASPDRVAAFQASLEIALEAATTLLSVHQVRRAVGMHPGVWRLALADGRCLIGKQLPAAGLVRGRPFDPLTVAREVDRLLEGCPIAPVAGVDPGRCMIYYAWCGDATLDDICQTENPSACREFADQAVEGFSLVCDGFARNREALHDRVFPGCDVADLRKGWDALRVELERDLPRVCDRFGLSAEEGVRVTRTTVDLLATLGGAEPSLGATDYNARNIVADRETGRVRFIEFEKIGWDWDERLLVQYTTGMGGGLTEGRFRSLLTAGGVARFAASADGTGGGGRFSAVQRVDGHHLVFHVLAACRLCRAMTDVERGEPRPDLLDFWCRPEDRLAQLREILSLRLSANPCIGSLRAALGGAQV